MGLQEGGSTLGGFDIEAQLVEPLHQRQSLRLVLVRDGGKDGAVILQAHTGCLEGLIQCPGQGPVVADGFAGGLHFGRQVGVQTTDLIEGEDGRLYIPALLLVRIDIEDTLFLQALAQDHFGGDIRQRVAGGLAQEGYGTGRPGVDLDNEHIVVLIHNELNIEQAHDADAQAQLLGILQDDAFDLIGDGEGGIDRDGVTGVDAGPLNQFHDAGDEDIPAVADRIDLHFAALNVLVNQNRLVLIDGNGGLQVVTQLLFVGHDLHGPAAQNEAGAHQHRVADFRGGRNAVFDLGNRTALSPGNIQLVQQIFKGVPVLGLVDGGAVGTDNLHAPLHQRLSQVDCGLAAQRCDDALRLLELDDVHHILRSQRLEVQLVGGGVVGGDGLRVVVDDDGLVAGLTDGHDRVDRGVVKLHTLTDTDGAGAQNHDLLLFGENGIVFAGVGGVEIRNVGVRMAGIHHLIGGENTVFLTQIIDLDFLLAPQLRDELIAEAHGLGFLEDFQIAHIGGELPLHGNNLADGLQEVRGDLGDPEELLYRHIPAQQLGNGKDIVIPELLNIAQQFLGGKAVELGQVEVAGADLQRADGFQEALLQIGADAHDLAGGLHLSTQGVGGRGELIEGEPGQLGNHIIQAGLESGVGIGDLDILQSHAHGNLGGNPGNGVAGCLGSQCGGTGNTGVNLDEEVFGGIGVQGKLDIAAAFDLQLPNDLDSGVIQHLQIVVVQGHDGGNHQAVAGVDAHGVDIFHAADGDGMVIGVAHDLELDLLVALDRLFNQHLMDRRQLEGVQADLYQLFFVVSEAAAGTAQGKGGTQDHGISDPQGCGLGFLDGVSNLGGDDRLADGLAQFLEQLPILSPLDGLAGGAQQLDPAFLQHALLLQLHCQVQAGLTADAGNNGVGALIADDLGDVFQSQGLHVDLIRNDGIRHDGSGVGVDQHHLIALFLQGQAGLGAGVVKLRSLTDDDRAGADDHNFLDVCSLCHDNVPPKILRSILC